MLRLITSATGLVLLTLLALATQAGAQQAPELRLSATLGQGDRDGDRAMTVTAEGARGCTCITTKRSRTVLQTIRGSSSTKASG